MSNGTQCNQLSMDPLAKSSGNNLKCNSIRTNPLADDNTKNISNRKNHQADAVCDNNQHNPISMEHQADTNGSNTQRNPLTIDHLENSLDVNTQCKPSSFDDMPGTIDNNNTKCNPRSFEAREVISEKNQFTSILMDDGPVPNDDNIQNNQMDRDCQAALSYCLELIKLNKKYIGSLLMMCGLSMFIGYAIKDFSTHEAMDLKHEGVAPPTGESIIAICDGIDPKSDEAVISKFDDAESDETVIQEFDSVPKSGETVNRNYEETTPNSINVTTNSANEPHNSSNETGMPDFTGRKENYINYRDPFSLGADEYAVRLNATLDLYVNPTQRDKFQTVYTWIYGCPKETNVCKRGFEYLSITDSAISTVISLKIDIGSGVSGWCNQEILEHTKCGCLDPNTYKPTVQPKGLCLPIEEE